MKKGNEGRAVTNAIKMYKKFKFKIKKYISQYYNTSNKEENNAYKMILNDYGSRFNTYNNTIVYI